MSNTITFHGRLTKDCWQGSTGSGKAMLRFSVASDVGFGENQHTNYFDVVIVGKRAETRLSDYLRRGVAVYVSGELKIEPPREHNGKYYNNITIFNPTLDLIDKQPGAQGGSGSPRQGDATPEFDDSEIPFLSMRGEW